MNECILCVYVQKRRNETRKKQKEKKDHITNLSSVVKTMCLSCEKSNKNGD